MRPIRRNVGLKALAACAAALCVVGVVAAPAGAQSVDRAHRDRRISISGGLVIASDETVNGPVVSIDGPAVVSGVVKDDVFVAHGTLRVNGRITGDVLVGDGDAIVNGRVRGDVISILGRVIVRDGASVGGDVVSRRPPQIASGTVHGKVRRLNIRNILRGFLITFLVFLWISVTISVAILGLLFVLLFPRAADATVAAGRRVWPSFGWGALVGIIGPIAGVLVLVTVVGIPLGLGILSALAVLSPLGYAVAALSLGRTMVKGLSSGARIGAFFAGFGILRAAAILPAIGFLVWFLACLYGLGSLTIAAWRAGNGTRPPPGDQEREPTAPAPVAAVAWSDPPTA